LTQKDLTKQILAGTIPPASVDSAALEKRKTVSRRRFQRGSVFLSKAKTMWLGAYASYVLDSNGVETRKRREIVLCPVLKDGVRVTKRDAQKLLQPFLDGVNNSIAAPDKERKSITFAAFAEIWERDYLSLSKRSTQSAMRSCLKRLATLNNKDMRQIGAGDIQRLISAMKAEGLAPKTIRNLWGIISLIWAAALAQEYVDALLPKPALPRNPKKSAKFFTTAQVAEIIAASEGENEVFYWLAAETGLRSGELAGLKITDIDGDTLTVNQSVWGGEAQDPKTDNALRTLALSPQLITLLWEQIARQKGRGHQYLFTSSTGTPWDMNLYRARKMSPLLKSLDIPQAGFHAFRHFKMSVCSILCTFR
jgi:integrase